MIFLTADTLMFNFLNILFCELTVLVSIWIKIFDFLINLHVHANYMVKSV